jgi:hypothetical protein
MPALSTPPSIPRYHGLCWPSGEQRLLLECLFLEERQRARAAFAAWRANVNLDRMQGGSLALMPMLHFRLNQLGVTDTMSARLKGAHRYHWCRGQILLRGAMEAIDALAAARIPVLALKGLAVLPFYGGDHGRRPMSDVDLLVPRAQGAAALVTLVREGWQLAPELARVSIAEAVEAHHGLALKRGPVEIDVHWSSLIEDTSPGGDARLWQRGRPAQLHGRTVFFPTPTDLLFHVCVHGARWSRAGSVIWVADCVHILNSAGAQALDWDALIGEAVARHLQVPLRETLRFLREALGVRGVPAEVVPALAPPEPAWLYWCDHHAFAADPAAGTVLHRTAARIMSKIRSGSPVTGLHSISPDQGLAVPRSG